MRTSNPILQDAIFDAKAHLTGGNPGTMMTVAGTLNKSLALFGILLASALAGSYLFVMQPGMGMPLVLGGAAIGFILALFLRFNPTLSPILAPIYAVFQGVAVGAVSRLYHAMDLQRAAERGTASPITGSIVLNAVILTFGVMGVMLLLYRARILRATPMFTKIVVFATMSIMLLYIVNLAMIAFGSQGVQFLHDAGPVGIGISLFICGVAALNFILDFDMIESGANKGAPKYMEWYAAFGLLVTVVWLYLEMLRLLNKLRR